MREKLLLLAGVTLVWWGGSTYWYVCRVQYLCSAKTTAAQPKNEVAQPKVEEPAPAAKTTPQPVQSAEQPKAAEPAKPTKPGVVTLYFLPDSTSYRDTGAAAQLDPVVAYLKADAQAKVSVAGYTTTIPGTITADQLALDRANLVGRYLTDRGIAASRVSAKAVGDREQVGDVTTEQGQANNRRVVVTLE